MASEDIARPRSGDSALVTPLAKGVGPVSEDITDDGVYIAKLERALAAWQKRVKELELEIGALRANAAVRVVKVQTAKAKAMSEDKRVKRREYMREYMARKRKNKSWWQD